MALSKEILFNPVFFFFFCEKKKKHVFRILAPRINHLHNDSLFALGN